MSKLVKRIINYILERRKNKLEATLKKLQPKNSANLASKTLVGDGSTLVISSEIQKKLEQMNEEIKNIVKPMLKQPKKMLDFVQEHGTPVYKFPQAKSVLNLIKEEEGFVTPLKGKKALWLNFAVGLIVEKRLILSLESREMFVLRDGEVNLYYMLHQFHKWFGFKENLPGYDAKSQELFKANLSTMTAESTKELSVDEIISLKEAIARDSEASSFALEFAKEISGAKKAHEKMQQDDGAQI